MGGHSQAEYFAMQGYWEMPLEWGPGEGYQYTNANFQLATYIVKKVRWRGASLQEASSAQSRAEVAGHGRLRASLPLGGYGQPRLSASFCSWAPASLRRPSCAGVGPVLWAVPAKAPAAASGAQRHLPGHCVRRQGHHPGLLPRCQLWVPPDHQPRVTGWAARAGWEGQVRSSRSLHPCRVVDLTKQHRAPAAMPLSVCCTPSYTCPEYVANVSRATSRDPEPLTRVLPGQVADIARVQPLDYFLPCEPPSCCACCGWTRAPHAQPCEKQQPAFVLLRSAATDLPDSPTYPPAGAVGAGAMYATPQDMIEWWHTVLFRPEARACAGAASACRHPLGPLNALTAASLCAARRCST